MSKSSPRALQELMTAVDAGHAVDVYIDSASSDSTSKLLGSRRRRSSSNYYGGGGGKKSAPPVAVAVVDQASSDASFEFSTAVNSYSSASPASMVFSGGQLRAHQFPAVAVRSSAGISSSQATSPSPSPVRSSSVGSSFSSTASKRHSGGSGMMTTGSKKRVSFVTDGADKAAAAAANKAAGGGLQGMKKSGGLLGCMSACGPSSRNEAVEPVARNDNRKVAVAF